MRRRWIIVLVLGLLLAVNWTTVAAPKSLPSLPPSVNVTDGDRGQDVAVVTSGSQDVGILSASEVWVDDGYCGTCGNDGHTWGTDAFATIQAGIDAVDASGKANVAAGTYVENVIVNKSVILAGAGAGSTIVMPAVSSANPCTGSSLCGGAASNVFLVQANDVVIRDLTVDGDNPGLTSGIVRGGADVDARNGIIKNTDATYDNLEVYNVTVKNIYLRGIYSTGGTFNFHDNTVTNVQGDGYSIGMFAWYGPGTMRSNSVSYANDAISANHSKGIQFLNNTVTNSGSGVHTDNAGDGGGTADLIQGNHVTCAGTGYGVWVFVPYLAPTLDQNTVTGCDVGLSAWGQGAAVTSLFTNNTVTGPANATGSVGAYITTDLISWGYADVSVELRNNLITDFETAVYLTADPQPSWNPEPYVAKPIYSVFRDNSFDDNTYGMDMGTSGTYNADASANWWGSADPATVKTAANGGSIVDYTPWLASGTDTSADPGFQGDFSTLWVDDDSPQTGTTGRIQEGINLVSGSTVNVAAGTYPEPLNIEGKAGLTLSGADKATVIMQPTSTLCFDVGGYGCGRRAAYRVVGSTNVALENMTFDFSVAMGNNVIGLLLWDSTGTVNNNILKNMSGADASEYYLEITSYVRAPSYTDGARAQVAFTGNTFVDTGRIGIVTHDFVHTTISGNTFHKDFDDFGYAMEIGSESTAIIASNIIDGYDTPAASDGSQSGGIYIENAFTGSAFGTPVTGVTKNVSVTGNEIYGCQWAMYIGNEFNGYAGDVDIVVAATGNNLHDNVDGAVAITDEDKSDGSSVTYTGSGNTLANNGGDGYSIYTGGDGDVTMSLDGETISGQEVGIHLQDLAATPPSGSSYSTDVYHSSITGNTSYGIQNEYSGTTIDAENNYWGTVNSSEIAPRISGSVDWSPWCNSDFTVCTYTWPVHNITQGTDYQTIQAAIDAANAGDVIQIDEGTYDITTTIVVNKAVSIGPTPGATVKLQGTNSGAVSIFEISASNVMIEDLEITHNALPVFVSAGWAELPNSLIRVPVSLGVSGIVIQGNTIYVPTQSGAMSTWNGVAITVGSNTTTGITISGNTIRNTRNGVVIQTGNTATVSNNIIYDTKGGLMNYTSSQADADNRTISNNSWGATHNEWDIVWNTAYYVPDYQQSVLALSAANNGAYVLDRRAADAAACAALTGNRSHIFVDAVSAITAPHPAKGNFNEPFQNLDLAWQAVVPGGTVYVFRAGTYGVSDGTHPGGLVVTADDVTITGPGAINCGTAGGVGILVQGGADNFILDSARVTGCANGVELAGDVTSFKIVNNWVDSNTGNGLLVDAGVDLEGIVTIEGNLFKVNGGNGIQHNGNGTLPAEYNSWGDPGGPAGLLGDGIGGSVDADPWTYVEGFLDVYPDTLALERHVPENTSFDVALKADAVNLYGLDFALIHHAGYLTLNSVTFSAPWAGKCYNRVTGPEIVIYACSLREPDAEWTVTAGTVATLNFTAHALPDDNPATIYLDLSFGASAKGGQQVFVNNAGYNAPSVPDRDIADAEDGRIIIERLANYTGFVDLQGRANDSGASIAVYNQALKSGATLKAQAASASSGAYTTAHVPPEWLAAGSTYWIVVDRALYLPTTPLATDYEDSKLLNGVPLTSLAKVLLLGGDATNDDGVLVTDLACIGGNYGGAGIVCGVDGWSDVNGDGTVNVQDLSMCGGNLYKTSSPWTP